MFSHLGPQGTGAKYQVVKVCALLSPLDPVSGVGEEAYVRNNRGNFAELIARSAALVDRPVEYRENKCF